MIPRDAPLNLPVGALRPWALVLLIACAAVSIAIPRVATSGRRSRPTATWARTGRTTAPMIAILLTALALRAGLSLVQDGGLYDIFDAYRIVGAQLRNGGDVFVEPALGLSNYPPAIYWWWALASSVPSDHPHLYSALVRLPFWVADAAVAPFLVMLLRHQGAEARTAVAAGVLYAINPVAMAVPALHGQFDPLVVLPLVGGIALIRRRPGVAGVMAGAATAIKPWPVFFIVPLLALMMPRQWPRFIAGLIAAPAATFALYGLIHPEHLIGGLYRVATYVAHRQGLGTSLLFRDGVPTWVVTTANLLAGAASSTAGLVAARRGRSPAETMAVAMLVLLTLSPTVSDQYLMWPIPFLLMAGRLRMVAFLSAGLLPAVAGLNLWTSQNAGATRPALLLLGTAAMAAASLVLISSRGNTDTAALSATPA
ncbi:MAG: glycosyltransferase 87 family protein [Candidatus Dormibacteria bacterium]